MEAQAAVDAALPGWDERRAVALERIAVALEALALAKAYEGNISTTVGVEAVKAVRLVAKRYLG